MPFHQQADTEHDYQHYCQAYCNRSDHSVRSSAIEKRNKTHTHICIALILHYYHLHEYGKLVIIQYTVCYIRFLLIIRFLLNNVTLL